MHISIHTSQWLGIFLLDNSLKYSNVGTCRQNNKEQDTFLRISTMHDQGAQPGTCFNLTGKFDKEITTSTVLGKIPLPKKQKLLIFDI